MRKRYKISLVFIIAIVVYLFNILSLSHPYLFTHYPQIPQLRGDDVVSITYFSAPPQHYKIIIRNEPQGIYIIASGRIINPSTGELQSLHLKQKIEKSEFDRLIAQINYILTHAKPDRFAIPAMTSTDSLVIETKTHGNISIVTRPNFCINGKPYKLGLPQEKNPFLTIHSLLFSALEKQG